MLPIILGVFVPFFIAFAIFGVYLFTNVFNDSSINDYETVEVDNYVGATFTSELEQSFKDSAYFRLSGVEYQYDEETPMGVIIGQSPSAGEMKRVLKNKRFCNISLVISGGTEKFTLKDYMLEDYRLVKSELNSMKIKVNVIKQESIVHAPGTIMQMSPEPGTVIKVGESVDLYISRGAGEEDLLMPDLVGKDEAEVLLIMVENKLRVGKITYEKSTEPVGTVISQSIEKETPTYFYTVVDFVLSGGEKYGEVETTKPPETDPDSGSDSDSESTDKKEPSSGMQAATNTTAKTDEPTEVTPDDPTSETNDDPNTSNDTTEDEPKPTTPTDPTTDSNTAPSTPVESTDESTDVTVTPGDPVSSETDTLSPETDPVETN
jgi:beta-lactam-binding protein with PASTA domain